MYFYEMLCWQFVRVFRLHSDILVANPTLIVRPLSFFDKYHFVDHMGEENLISWTWVELFSIRGGVGAYSDWATLPVKQSAEWKLTFQTYLMLSPWFNIFVPGAPGGRYNPVPTVLGPDS